METTTTQNSAVAEETKQARQKVVLAAIDIFLSQGIGETSMEDIARRAGLATEKVYDIFPRKNDILRIIGAANKAAASGSLDELLQESPVTTPDEMLLRTASFFTAGGDAMRMVPQAWGVALYDKEINTVIRDVFDGLQNQWVELAKRMADEGQLPDGADPESVGRTLGCLIVGYMVLSLLHDVTPEHLHRGLQELRRRVTTS
jgi:TetR/AcrR family transcriptional regulator, transcriptional repressor of aconitase